MSKKNFRVIVGAFFVVLLGSVALAHPPSGIIASFDPETYLLEIRIPHSVANAKGDHYVSEIRVYRNGTEIITQYVQSQFSPQEQRVQYLIIDAAKGDTLTVYARCSKFGEKKVDLTIE
ncbi:MAG: hypothetical protein ABDK87_07290 [Atribacterota bacterium]